MKFCPQCGAQNDDSNSFCYMCGASFNGDIKHEEPKAEHTEKEQPYVPPYSAQIDSADKRKKTSGYGLYAVLALIVAAIILVAALIPVMISDQSTYDVTLTVESVSINDSAKQYTVDAQGFVTYSVDIGYGNGSADKTCTFKSTSENYKCKTDGTPTEAGLEKHVTISGNPSDFVFTVFLYVETGSVRDYVDIYTEEHIDGEKPSYIGYSGVRFTMSEVKDGKITLTGDSDPIGSIVLSITYVKK